MAETRPKNPFSTKRWKKLKFQAPQDCCDLLTNDGEYSVYKGKIDGETSFFLVGRFGSDIYACSISKERLSQLENLQDKLRTLNCRFKQNESVNPFEGWQKVQLNMMIRNYEARVSRRESGSNYCIGRFGDSCYTFNISDKDRRSGIEIDWVRALGVCVRY